jgi:hypothetical protein
MAARSSADDLHDKTGARIIKERERVMNADISCRWTPVRHVSALRNAAGV